MAYVSFIPDKALETEVQHLLNIAHQAQQQSQNKFGKNVIDPFTAFFEMAGFNLDHKAWSENEMTRQAQKTLQNHIGTFHQNILGRIAGWNNLATGSVIDLVNHDLKIIAEVKNKYNTISGGKLADLYTTLDSLVMPKASSYKDYTAYYVSIIPRKPERFNRPFTPSDKNKGTRCQENMLIREIDGSSFYTLATGSPNALQNLYDALPHVVKAISDSAYSAPDLAMLKKYFAKAFGKI